MENTICLVMICRNEESFIVAALESVRDLVSYYVIVDSESTDNTVELIKQTMAGIDGIVINYTKPFRGDEKRTYAIDAAKGTADYLLVMDADNILDISKSEPWNPFTGLTEDAYYITKKMGDYYYPLLSLYRGDLDWEYIGVIHDFPARKDGKHFTTGTLEDVIIHEPVKTEGARFKSKERFHEDALCIEQELVKNPNLSELLKSRYMFYLGQSYKDAGMLDRAVVAYTLRSTMGGWKEEVYYSLYMVAILYRAMNRPKDVTLIAALKAWQCSPYKLEAAYLVAEMLCEVESTWAAWAIMQQAKILAKNRMGDHYLFYDKQTVEYLFPNLYRFLESKYGAL